MSWVTDTAAKKNIVSVSLMQPKTFGSQGYERPKKNLILFFGRSSYATAFCAVLMWDSLDKRLSSTQTPQGKSIGWFDTYLVITWKVQLGRLEVQVLLLNVTSPTSSSESTIVGDCTYLKIGGCLVPYAETGECFAMVVPDRTKNTLWPLKASRTAAGLTVYVNQ